MFCVVKRAAGLPAPETEADIVGFNGDTST
jgi:hypothetical protein